MLDAFLDFAAHGLANAGWLAILLYVLVTTQLTIFAVTLYLHRSQAHRGVDFHPVVSHFLRFWNWLATGMVTKEWVAVHRKHHAHCETEQDPHSPQVAGIGKVFFEGAELYRVAAANEADLEKYGRGTPDDWMERHVYTPHPILGVSLLAVIDLALFGVLGGAIWALQMVWIPFWAAGVVNGLGHWWGYRNFETADKATNLTPWGVWVGGEELHNNHHAFPSSAKFALRKFEVDIGWLIIRGLEKVRLAKVLRVAPSLDERPNVSLPDMETLKALLTHRFEAMTDYYKTVIKPTVREQSDAEGTRHFGAMPRRRLRRALANGGRWLDQTGKARLAAIVENRPRLQQINEYRARLAALMEQRRPESALAALQQWCREAEASGNRKLIEFAARLKRYSVARAQA
ncbi:MAG TPA: fatty acid desaturase [Rhodanobacteraceae bacterium]|jgi:stearoyl-CoA desaturase (delta-9 desaturase)|nr:fatty acid desaturase [Rhodanobacteraceae bacterium]